jgi:hypothetical protein
MSAIYICSSCIFVSLSLEGISRTDYSGIWTAFGRRVKHAAKAMGVEVPRICSQSDFLDAFTAQFWPTKVVILLDEFSELYGFPDDFRDDFLRCLRDLKQDDHQYGIHGVIAAGTFSILHLNPTISHSSPFNIADMVQNPYFSLEETRALFHQFRQDNDCKVEDAVVDDIWAKSNG